MKPEDLATTFRIAVGMNLSRLPQLKGKGAVTDRTELDRAVSYFADSVLERLKLSGIELVQRPPRETAGPKLPGETVAIPVGLPRAEDPS